MKKILYIMIIFLIVSIIGKLSLMLDTNNETQTTTTTTQNNSSSNETFEIYLDNYEIIF